MAEGNVDSAARSITAELKVYMHCDACERLVRRSVEKIEGVEAVEVDREENKVTVTGDFRTEKLLKKIKKKTGKKAEILIPEENEEEDKGGEPDVPYYDGHLVQGPWTFAAPEFQNRWPEARGFHYFDDENAEACVVM